MNWIMKDKMEQTKSVISKKLKLVKGFLCTFLAMQIVAASICGAKVYGIKRQGVMSLSNLSIALAADYEEELEWSQMEVDLLDGNSVEWILSDSIYEQGQAMEVEPNWRIELSQEELDLLERCVMAEGGGESYECQVAIACVVVNRVLSDVFPDTLTEVVTQQGQFSTWPTQISHVTATNSVRQAVREALSQAVFPEDLLYFRADYYHSWGTAYCKIDHTYFSMP